MDFVYERTFPVGKEHTGVFPHVHDFDWNPNAPSYDALGVLVCASRGGTVIIRIDDHGQRHSGTLLCNRKSPPGRHTLSCKWSIHDPRILATGGSHRRENTKRGCTGGIIRLLMYNGTRFEVMQSFKVHDGEDVSQLSWEREGKFLLATVNRGGGQAKLYIINHASRSRSKIAQIIDHPQADSSTPLVYTAKFHPVDPLFISVAGDTVWIWPEDTIQSKWKDTHVLKINAHLGQSFCRHPLVCFDERGEMLAVCEGDNSISVWSFVPEGMIRRPEMKLLTRRVDLERIVSLDWIKRTIVVVNASSTCVYTVNKNLLINGTGDLKLKCKRLSHTHYYEQLCVKIDPRRNGHVASGGKDGYATVWKCVDKKDTVPMRKRNYLAEALYYKREGSPPSTDIKDQTGDDDIDVRTLIRCETSDCWRRLSRSAVSSSTFRLPHTTLSLSLLLS